MARLVDIFHVFKDIMCKRVDDSHPYVIVVRVLWCDVNKHEEVWREERAEYEFSPSLEEPVARILGE